MGEGPARLFAEVMSMTHEDRAEEANQVVLQGRITAEPVERELPSGTRIVTFRLSVPRTSSPMTTGSRQTSDWVDCSVWGGRAMRSARGWRAGDRVEVRGALRRRYLRGADTGVGSRIEVEVLGGRVLLRAADSDPPQSAAC